MNLPFGIQQSTLAGGISGLLTWGAGIGLAALGVTIPATAIAPICLLVATVVVHYVPDAANIDTEIKNLAKVMPTTEAKYDISKNKPNL